MHAAHFRDFADSSGKARLDLVQEPSSEEFYVNEINTVPAFASVGMYPKPREDLPERRHENEPN
ncbi:MAG: hypothetical protein ACE5JI_04180 [Acidobacteriota bacterium]